MTSSNVSLEHLTDLKKQYRSLWNSDGSPDILRFKSKQLWSENLEQLESEIESIEKKGILNTCTRCGAVEEGIDYGFGLSLRCQSCLEETGLC